MRRGTSATLRIPPPPRPLPLCSSPPLAEGYQNDFRRQQSYLFAPPLTVLSLKLGSDEPNLLCWPLDSTVPVHKNDFAFSPTIGLICYFHGPWCCREIYIFWGELLSEVNAFGSMRRKCMQIWCGCYSGWEEYLSCWSGEEDFYLTSTQIHTTF